MSMSVYQMPSGKCASKAVLVDQQRVSTVKEACMPICDCPLHATEVVLLSLPLIKAILQAVKQGYTPF